MAAASQMVLDWKGVSILQNGRRGGLARRIDTYDYRTASRPGVRLAQLWTECCKDLLPVFILSIFTQVRRAA